MTSSWAGPRLALIDNSIDPTLNKSVRHWAGHLSPGWRAFTARKGEFPDIEEFSHFILSGSEDSITQRAEWAEEEADLVREAVVRGKVILGSCWGHQLLAYALAGPDSVGHAAVPELGWIRIRVVKPDGLFGGRRDAAVFSLHFDEVKALPNDMFEVLAVSDECRIHALRLRNRPVWGLQSHPEIDIPTGTEFLRQLVERGSKGSAEAGKALADVPEDSGLIDDVIREFLAARPLQGRFRRISP